MQLWLKIRAWGEWWQSSSCDNWHPNRRKVACSQSLICVSAQTLWLATILGITVRFRNRGPVIVLEISFVPTAEKRQVLLTVFVDQDGVVHHELTPEGETVNEEYYLQVTSSLLSTSQASRKIVVRGLANPPWQCSSALGSTCATFLSQTRSPTNAAIFIFSRSCTV